MHDTVDTADAPVGDAAEAPLRLPDHATLTAEDLGDVPIAELVTAQFHPAPPQDRIEHPLLSPPALEAVAKELTDTLAPNNRGRHNRYRPVPGEDGLRTDDLADFAACYGHEYQVMVFRAADVRASSLLDVPELTRIGVAEKASVFWDWTGAVDWAQELPGDDTTVVFWSTHHSLVDGRRIEAGWWKPADGPAPEAIAPAPLAPEAAARARRIADRAALAAVGSFATVPGVAVLHPTGRYSLLPVLVIESQEAAGTIADALCAGPGFRSVVRYGERVVALPDPGGSAADVIDRIAEAAAWCGGQEG